MDLLAGDDDADLYDLLSTFAEGKIQSSTGSKPFIDNDVRMLKIHVKEKYM